MEIVKAMELARVEYGKSMAEKTEDTCGVLETVELEKLRGYRGEWEEDGKYNTLHHRNGVGGTRRKRKAKRQKITIS